MNARKYKHRNLLHLLSMPLIYANLLTIVAADLVLEIYHRLCFPLYGLPYVDRKKYIRIDRYRLKYLPLQNKIGCMYCAYANGWVHYAAEIAANTEEYWCGIKHEKIEGLYVPKHHENFVEYGDEKAFKERYSSG
jgi:hypothetical protein